LTRERRRANRWRGILATGLLALRPVGGAPIDVDQGSFTITVGGVRTGRETFVIRRSGAGTDAGYLASGTALYPDRRLAPALTTDATGVPTTFVMEVRSGTQRTARVSAQMVRGLFSVRVQTATGESMRELLLRPRTVLLDDDLFALYYFVGLDRRSGAISVVDPRRGIQTAGALADIGPDSVTIGGRVSGTEHLRLVLPGADHRELWCDSAGRVLRVDIPDRQLTALRDDVPR